MSETNDCNDSDHLLGVQTDLLVEEYTLQTDECVDELNNAAYPKHHKTSITLAIQAAVSHEDELSGYLRHVYLIFRNSSSAIVCRTLLTSVAIFIFTIGIIRFRECPYEQELPLFLVLEGLAIIVKTGVNVINACFRWTNEENERNTLDTCSDILSLFLVLWTLTGSVWTFGIYSHVTLVVDEDSQYCDKLVYMCALWYLITLYCCVSAVLLVIIVLCVYHSSSSNDVKKQLPYEISVER